VGLCREDGEPWEETVSDPVELPETDGLPEPVCLAVWLGKTEADTV